MIAAAVAGPIPSSCSSSSAVAVLTSSASGASCVPAPLLGAVDTAVMGHLPGPAYIGGVAIGALIFSYVYWAFGFLRMGTTGLVAQAFGARDADEIRAVLARAWLLAAGLAALILFFQKLIGLVAFALLDTSPEVGGLAETYYSIRVWGAPAALMDYVALGWLFGMVLVRSAERAELVLAAMKCRGYRGELHVISDLRMTAVDWLGGLIFLSGLAALTTWGHGL